MDLVDGKITEAGVRRLRELIGSPLNGERNSYNSTSDYDNVKHWCFGIGDGNPLWFDRQYGSASVVGQNLAPPSFLYTVCGTFVQIGLRGVHGFHSGSDWEWFKPIRHGQRIAYDIWLDDVVEQPSRMAGRSVVLYFSTVFSEADGSKDVLAHARSWSFRVERSASQGRGKNVVELADWADDDLDAIDRKYAQEDVRGGDVRYWEDVSEGDRLSPVHKGPLCLSDMISFYSGGMPIYAPAHGMAYEDNRKHPAWWFRNPRNGGLEPNARVHEDPETAKSAGVPAPYDIGLQRNSWLIHLLTNWGGDAAFLRRCNAQYRRFNYYGDFTVFSGSVERKYTDDSGLGLVDLALEGRNQRGEVTIPATATVELPTRDGDELPVIRALKRGVSREDYLAALPDVELP